MENHFTDPNRQPQVRAVAKQRKQHRISDHPQIIAFLLAALACYLFLLLLSHVAITDYSAGCWALFN